ncbi:enterotoxin [Streptomyces sp. NBC_01725]|uniref:FAD-dependent oxidoreductase n=1 Tax=Streptomyces sp. NBC_01725 TaxID=2975923 RepID=UPI002E2AE0DA|nr:FAD-dependent monooxygenase [Streptomyces sp. NBC_01725]
MSGGTHAVVLGGSVAGLLAAAALAPYVGSVTVVERDEYPAEGPAARTGVPQAEHAHVLWSGGARAVERLLPGATERLLAAGARRVGVQRDMLLMSAAGWCERFPETQYMLTCSRALLEWVLRGCVLALPNVSVLEGTVAAGLAGDAGAVSGVRVRARDGEGGAERLLAADVVVDATGRGSGLSGWLTGFGLPAAEEETVDSGLTYTTRVFRAPEGAAGVFPVVSLYADHRVAKPARNGLVVPIEGDRWMVSLSGSRGARPPADAAGFAAFARSLRHPLVARMVAAAEPLTEPRSTRSTRNRRLRYERMPSWPAGLLVLGDALSALNPAYGHGMTAAARGAEALRDELAAHGVRPERARETVGAISAAVDDPWLWATSQDVRFPECRIVSRDAELGSRAEARARFADLLQAAASRDAGVNVAMAGVMSMSEPLAGLEDAGVLDAVRAAAASGAKPLPQPRLSGAELALLRGPARVAVR